MKLAGGTFSSAESPLGGIAGRDDARISCNSCISLSLRALRSCLDIILFKSATLRVLQLFVKLLLLPVATRSTTTADAPSARTNFITVTKHHGKVRKTEQDRRARRMSCDGAADGLGLSDQPKSNPLRLWCAAERVDGDA